MKLALKICTSIPLPKYGKKDFTFMPRGQITKEHFKVLILQQKNKIHYGPYGNDFKDVSNMHLNELLDRLDEFRY